MLSSLPRRLVRNAVRRSNFHQSTSVIEDPLGLDKDYGKDSVVRVFFLLSLTVATFEKNRLTNEIRYFLEIDRTKERITN